LRRLHHPGLEYFTAGSDAHRGTLRAPGKARRGAWGPTPTPAFGRALPAPDTWLCRRLNAGSGRSSSLIPDFFGPEKDEPPNRCWGVPKKIRRRPTLPQGLPCSTIGADELNFRVRDGIGCDIVAITTGNLRNHFRMSDGQGPVCSSQQPHPCLYRRHTL
jgi:hypothetical protein